MCGLGSISTLLRKMPLINSEISKETSHFEKGLFAELFLT